MAMNQHKGFWPREGIYLDPIARIIDKTLLNPALMLPFVIAANTSNRAKLVSLIFAKQYRRIKFLLYLGLARWVHKILTWGVLNNWTSDRYSWGREKVVITGGAGGIGGLVAQGLASRGIRVIVLDILPLSYKPSPSIAYYKVDLSKYEQIQEVCKTIVKEHGHPTILVNNAGLAAAKTILEATRKDIELTYNVNVLAHYWMVKEFLPDMIKNNHGMVVTVASIAGYVTPTHMSDYCTTKAAAISFHEALEGELVSQYKAPKVRTVLVTPGFAKTPLTKGIKMGEGSYIMPLLEAETVAEAIQNQILSGTSGHLLVPGFGNVVGTLRAMPNWLTSIIRKAPRKDVEQYQGRKVIDPNVEPASPSTPENKTIAPSPAPAPRAAPPPVPAPRAAPPAGAPPAAPAGAPPAIPQIPSLPNGKAGKR